MLTFASCKNEVGGKAPTWLRGKTWSGNVTITSMGMSGTEYLSFTFDDEGELYTDDLPEGITVITSGNSNTFRISISGYYIEGGIRSIIDATFVFTKVNNNKCKIDGSVSATTPGAMMTASLSGSLYGY